MVLPFRVDPGLAGDGVHRPVHKRKVVHLPPCALIERSVGAAHQCGLPRCEHKRHALGFTACHAFAVQLLSFRGKIGNLKFDQCHFLGFFLGLFFLVAAFFIAACFVLDS